MLWLPIPEAGDGRLACCQASALVVLQAVLACDLDKDLPAACLSSALLETCLQCPTLP